MGKNIEEMLVARRARGMEILESGVQPEQTENGTWIIPSSDQSTTYTIENTDGAWTCSYPDFYYRSVECKHIHAVKTWQQLRQRFHQAHLRVQQTVPAMERKPAIECKFCQSRNIIKYGKKNGKQNYMCKECGRKFVKNVDFEKMKYSPKVIALTLDLYFKGVSLRKISHHLKEFYDMDIAHTTVHRWIEKYVGIMNKYVSTLTPSVGNTWHTDEMMVNVAGNWEYLWNVMDEDTRFHLASIVSKERKIRDAQNVFKAAKMASGGRKPKYIVTDGLPAYNKGVRNEFTTKTKETIHIKGVGLRHQHNNNHVERLHGTIRDREKTMRAVKKSDTPVIDGHKLYYNFIKPHEAIDGKTPAEQAGINIEGDENKWMNLLQKAVEHNNKQTVEVAQ
jgi:transposase-like protein